MLRHLDLFSGIGGFALAARIVGGIETRQFVEIEPYCQKVLTKNFPGVPIHDDIRTYAASLGGFDIITGGFPCFVAGTLILTFDGYKPIESLSIGELVLTHKGQWKPVTKLMVKHNAPLREVKALGVHSLVTTNEHPFYAVKRSKQWDNNARKYLYSFSDRNWIDAIDLTSQHYLGQTLPSEIQDNYSIAFWKMVGLYLADGWRVKRLNRPEGNGRVVICAAKKQASEVESIISEAGFKFSRVEERTVYKYHIVSKFLYEFLFQFGYKAEGKTIPGWVMGLSPEKAKALMNGLLFGDGWINQKGHARITTVSQKLAYSSALLAQRAYGCIASVFYAEMPEACFIEDRKVEQKPQFTVQITFNNLEKRSFLEGSYGWKRIRKNIKLNSVGTVYNLTVADDNSYIANGAIVHNCQDISCANPNGRGLEGERSGLFFELMRVVRECRPRYVVLENVAEMLRKQQGRIMGTVLWELFQSGYDAEWQAISAASVGAPHLRERVFIVATNTDRIGRSNGRDYWQGRSLYGNINGQAEATSQKWSGLQSELRSMGKTNALCNPDCIRLEDSQDSDEGWSIAELRSEVNANSDSTGCQKLNAPSIAAIEGYDTWASIKRGDYWGVEPGILRVANGISNRVDRIRGLGNAVVPQVAAIALQRVLELVCSEERAA